MTDEKLSDLDIMPAGPELDVLVAHHVLGWEFADLDDKQNWKRVPHFSWDLAAVWEVVEKMEVSSCSHSLRIDKFDGFFYVTFGVGGTRTFPRTHPQDYDGMAEDLPLAICRAALQAAGVVDV